MAHLQIYEWERQEFAPFFNQQICRAEQIKIVRKLNRHFLTPIAKKKSREYGYDDFNRKNLIKSFIKRYEPEIAQSHRRGSAGSYSEINGTIKLGMTTQLSTICHEFAHHLTTIKYGECKHNKRFKKELTRVYHYAEKWLEIPIREVE